MDKQPKEEINRSHPLLRQKSQVEQLLEKAAARAEEKEFQIEELDTWKACVNRLAATEDGQMFLTNMIKFSGINDAVGIKDTMKMVEQKTRIAFYQAWVRPVLEPKLRKEIE